MEAKEKARDLLKNMYDNGIDWEIAKECALIAVDEILNSNPCIEDYGGDGWILVDDSEYWKEVKEEIKRL